MSTTVALDSMFFSLKCQVLFNYLLPLPAKSLFSSVPFFPLDIVREWELSHYFQRHSLAAQVKYSMFALLFDAAQSHAREAFTDSATVGVTVALALLCSHLSPCGARSSSALGQQLLSHSFPQHLHSWQTCSAHPNAECCMGLLLTLLMASSLKLF